MRDDLGPDDVWFQFYDGAFLAECNGCRYVVCGEYSSLDEYSLTHGPTQKDVDVIATLLDGGQEPTVYRRSQVKKPEDDEKFEDDNWTVSPHVGENPKLPDSVMKKYMSDGSIISILMQRIWDEGKKQ